MLARGGIYNTGKGVRGLPGEIHFLGGQGLARGNIYNMGRG